MNKKRRVGMMAKGIPCETLIKAIQRYESLKGRGARAELSRETKLGESVLSKLVHGKQKTVSLQVWERLYAYDPDNFPPPALEKVAVQQGKQFTPKALKKYPILEIMIDHANESADEDFDQEVFLELCVNSLRNELIKKQHGGRCSAKKTG